MKKAEFEKVVPTWTEERIKKLVAERRYKAVPVDPFVFSDLVQKGITKDMEVKASGVPAKPHLRRPYNSISSVHQVKSANTFIKAMIMLANECEQIIKDITPNVWQQQTKIFEESVPKKWRLGNLWTSSISNFNIAAPFHRDTANIPGCVNIIIAKRINATGGYTTVPDYNATVDSADNSMLVYPAWRNVHGVTPIEPTHEGGYRNTLVFYPLRAFVEKQGENSQ